ncbi:MAG: hypothetical protein NXI00_00465 [Cytophagales bacterium]|nr:hypothetical protein [Cytophagales bacterium]
MIKTTGLVLLILGALALVVGVVGIFGNDLINISPYALSILGLVFFFAGTSMLKQRRDTDEI